MLSDVNAARGMTTSWFFVSTPPFADERGPGRVADSDSLDVVDGAWNSLYRPSASPTGS
jgi:hypothetical protein